MFYRIISFLIGVAIVGMPYATFAQMDLTSVQIKAVKVRNGIYMLEGKGGNLGVLVGSDGVLLIDDQFAPLTEKIRKAIAKISGKPIRFVINTHWHGDHTGGNENLGKTGSIIVAHENVRKRMSKEQFSKFWNKTVKASPKNALPVITFPDRLTFHLNGEAIEVMHVEDAHTDGDSIILFKKANVIHAGDVVFNGLYPYIDSGTGGSVRGVIAAIDEILKKSNRKTKIICGHGPMATRKDVKKYRKMLVTIADRVEKMKKEGKSVDEVVAAKPTQKFDEEWGNGFLKPDVFAKLVYEGL